ncbi:MAG TPA: ABC transporter ATP-binding protein [Brevefilum sp.]|nr:ABC transporter ATP-binding protein [Brevefilum sp.]HPL69854.1 ABC transporter ATP-binding protein [Brevefilum sp.]
MNNTVISVENLTKRYDLGVIGTGTLSRDLNRWWARVRKQPDPYTRIGQRDAFERIGESILALDDVSFTVQQGETLGIIGRNGAGKSTLLKILSRVTAPTSGVVKIKGRIGSLLEVGTGFHPELTGRENVFLNGAILGMRKDEVQRKFDEIVDFSGVEKFIDTPVKRYSSGMYVRLAFAVAAHLDPEILVVDEVLAVGDAEFQKKCLGKMGEVAGEGRTVLFVSHNMGAIQNLCKKSILLSDGRITHSGSSEDVVQEYLLSSNQKASINILRKADRRGSGGFRFTETWVENEKGEKGGTVIVGKPFKIVAEFEVERDTAIKDPYVAFALRDSVGGFISDLWNHGAGFNWPKLPERGKFTCMIPRCSLNIGVYGYNLFCGSKIDTLDHVIDAGKFEVIFGDFFGTNQLPSARFGKLLIDQEWALTDNKNKT